MKVKIEGARIEQVEALAAELGVHVIRRKSKHDDEVNVWIRPKQGTRHLRLFSKAGAVKNSLCLHGQYAFMSRLLARFPYAKLRTWVNLWDFQLFSDAARNWTSNQLREREQYDFCECTPDEVADLLRSPKEIMEGQDAEEAGKDSPDAEQGQRHEEHH
jgi:hypothetical protein